MKLLITLLLGAANGLVWVFLLVCFCRPQLWMALRPIVASVAVYVPAIRRGRGRQTPGAGRQVRQGGVRPRERSPDYRVVAAWVGFMLFIGAGAFAVGIAIHNEALANQHAPQARESSIYYCATGDEMPLFEPCKERKDQRDI